MPALFNFEVHTPYRYFYSGKAQVVILTLADGEIGIYANHAPFTAVVVTGVLRIKDSDGNWRVAFVSDGILEVKEHKNVLMVDCAEWPEEIDKERALESKEQAEKNLNDENFKFETDKAKNKLRRAENRLKVLETGNSEK
ncbi:MAG: ATP synthase F1 subunit epsilon [Treponema sp.]|jgi:F-type H+-transporting ATPase subunit epsilon|nr:ATP synthase F1 subunit epsilon [Treponema sp.]